MRLESVAWSMGCLLCAALGCKGDMQSAATPVPEPVVAAAAPVSMAASTPVKPGVVEVPAAELEAKLMPGCDPSAASAGEVLELASKYYQSADFARASACAELATDLMPQAVEAQHLRAAALTALARYDEAQVSFAMALALDPDDPETLADVADFYINILPPKRRQTTQVGLEYARRGSDRALARRRLDRALLGRLLLLEGEALNDLSHPEQALVRVEEALLLKPDLSGAAHELAVCLFNLGRVAEAEKSFLEVLQRMPDDPYAHHHLGLIFERTGRAEDGEAHFQRARELAPGEFLPPVILSPAEFRAEVHEAIAELPVELSELLSLVELEIVDVPMTEDLDSVTPPFAPTILGLFRGLPAGVEVQGAKEPARSLVLYRKNLGRAVRTRAELDRQIRRTLRHEIGHLQGYDEDELRRRGLE